MGRLLYCCLSEFRFQLLPLCVFEMYIHCARCVCVVCMRVVVRGGVNATYERENRTYDGTKDSHKLMTNIYQPAAHRNRLAFQMPSLLSVFLFCYDFRSISHRIGRHVCAVVGWPKRRLTSPILFSAFLPLLLSFEFRSHFIFGKLTSKSNFKWWMKDVLPPHTVNDGKSFIIVGIECVVFSRPPKYQGFVSHRHLYVHFKYIHIVSSITSHRTYMYHHHIKSGVCQAQQIQF